MTAAGFRAGGSNAAGFFIRTTGSVKTFMKKEREGEVHGLEPGEECVCCYE